MNSRLNRRDISLVAILMMVGVLVLGLGWFGAGEVQTSIVRKQAETSSRYWASFVQAQLSDPRATFLYGKLTQEDQELLAMVSEASGVFRYKMFNKHGQIVVASRLEDIGKKETRPYFTQRVLRGHTFTTFARGETWKEFHRQPGKGELVAETYVPINSNGHFEGAFALYLDYSGQATLLSEIVDRAKWWVLVVLAVIALIVADVIRRNFRDRNRELQAMARAHDSLAQAEREVLMLNKELEDRVVQRTAQLEKANADFERANADLERANEDARRSAEDVRRLNEELELRVRERTEQLNTTNDQLQRAIDSSNRLNETLEQRVAERTAEMNRAYECMESLNAGLERRVEERTAEVYRAYADIQKLNEDLERRVEERTVELARANEDIKALNEDLERRVEERTKELGEAQAELVRNERLAALGQLTATVSHELRNPLGAIRTAVYIVSTKTEGKGLGTEESLKRAERSITRCDNIINELLDYTRQTPLSMDEDTFDRWIGNVLDDQSIPDGIALHKHFNADTIVAFDQDRFRRVIINIVNNACEAMNDEKVSNPTRADHSVTVATRVEGDRIVAEIQDTGPGIPQHELEKIFEPLYSTKSFGVGLGLPTVRQIMQQHGGGIDISSDVGEGTSVSLWMPIDAAKRETPPSRGIVQQVA